MVKQWEVYTQLSVEQAASYDTVKDLILNGYELVLRFHTNQDLRDTGAYKYLLLSDTVVS